MRWRTNSYFLYFPFTNRRSRSLVDETQPSYCYLTSSILNYERNVLSLLPTVYFVDALRSIDIGNSFKYRIIVDISRRVLSQFLDRISPSSATTQNYSKSVPGVNKYKCAQVKFNGFGGIEIKNCLLNFTNTISKAHCIYLVGKFSSSLTSSSVVRFNADINDIINDINKVRIINFIMIIIKMWVRDNWKE